MLLVLAVIVSLSTGSIRIPVREVANILLDRTQNIPHAWILIIRNLRLPRILAACMVGGFLSVGGAVCQGLFRNPLSEPYLLGISSGAALGAAIAIVSGWTAIAPFAFAGAMGRFHPGVYRRRTGSIPSAVHTALKRSGYRLCLSSDYLADYVFLPG